MLIGWHPKEVGMDTVPLYDEEAETVARELVEYARQFFPGRNISDNSIRRMLIAGLED